jgi:hypothetical protein
MSHELSGESIVGVWRNFLGEFHAKLMRNIRTDANRVAEVDATGATLALGGDWAVAGRWCKWASAWPSRGELSLLTMLGKVFPTSDFRHGVTTPTLLFLGQCLAQCPVRNSSDLSSGLFTASAMLTQTEVFADDHNLLLISKHYQQWFIKIHFFFLLLYTGCEKGCS